MTPSGSFAHRLSAKAKQRLASLGRPRNLDLGKKWKQSFRIRFSAVAKKLYSEVYHKGLSERSKQRERLAGRNKVLKYPCGILEQAYRQLIAQGFHPQQGPRRPAKKPAGNSAEFINVEPRPEG
jgi:hypothetical protein